MYKSPTQRRSIREPKLVSKFSSSEFNAYQILTETLTAIYAIYFPVAESLCLK